MVRIVYAPQGGQSFKLGRNRPIARCRQFKFKHYVSADLPAPPDSCDYSPKAMSSISQVYLNDKLGDCVIAGIQHVEGILTANATGTPIVFSDLNTQWLYEQIAGYNPDDPSTDRGCDEQTALNFWQQHGLEPSGNMKAAAWIAIDASNALECSTALWLFENLVFGIELPDEWINPFPDQAGFTWDVAGPPDMDNGHCFIAYGYEDGHKKISTWGMTGNITNAAIAKYGNPNMGGQVYTVLSPDSIIRASAKAPNGFNFDQLKADLFAMS